MLTENVLIQEALNQRELITSLAYFLPPLILAVRTSIKRKIKKKEFTIETISTDPPCQARPRESDEIDSARRELIDYSNMQPTTLWKLFEVLRHGFKQS